MVKLAASLRAHPENLLQNMDSIEDKIFYKHLAIPYVILRQLRRFNFTYS